MPNLELPTVLYCVSNHIRAVRVTLIKQQAGVSYPLKFYWKNVNLSLAAKKKESSTVGELDFTRWREEFVSLTHTHKHKQWNKYNQLTG